MFASRFLIFGIPLIAGALAWWSAVQARLGRVEQRTHLVALLPQQDLGWNPFQRMTEAERQILDVVHEPLLRLHADGELVPALASSWRWTQRVTCWFDDEETAKVAARRLSALRGNRWTPWGLESARAGGEGLTLTFSKVAGDGAGEALKAINDLTPERATMLRISLSESGRKVFATFRQSDDGAPLQRVWWDDEQSGEVLVVGDAPAWAQALENAFRGAGLPPPDIRLVGDLTGLREPVLEFTLREGVRWHSGDRVVPEDVKATIQQVKGRGWAVGLERGLRDVQRVEMDGENGLRIVYRNFYGPAICDWVRLPILPQRWIEKHRTDTAEMAFSMDPPPGAGAFQLSRLDSRVLALSAVPRPGPEPRHRQVRILTGAGPFVRHMAFATGGADLAWQFDGPTVPMMDDPELQERAAPARGRLMVLWNTRSPILEDSRLREALAWATDREALVDELLDGRGRVSEGLFRRGVWYGEEHPVESYRPGHAQSLLAECGWLVDVNGIAKKPDQTFTFSLITTAGAPERERVAELLQQQWSQIGADVRVEALAPEVWSQERLPRGQFDGILLGMDYALSWDQSDFWHSGQRPPTGLNYAGIMDSRLDLLLDALAMEFDPDKVTARTRRVQERVMAERPLMTLFADRQEMIVRESLLPLELRADEDADVTLRDVLLPRDESVVSVDMLKMREPEVKVGTPDAPVVQPRMRVPEE